MPDRFSDLPHYLPPHRGRSNDDRSGVSDPSSEPIPPRRRRLKLPHRWIRRVGLFAALVVVAAASGALAARISMIEPPPDPGTVRAAPLVVEPPDPAPIRGDVRAARVLGIREHRTAPRPKPKKVPRRHRPRPTRRAIALPPSVPVPSPTPLSAAEHRRSGKQRQKPKSQRRKRPEPIPAPPGTPLFDCYSGEKVDHFITTDRASAGQAETSRGKYVCSVVGYVYAYPAPHTRSIEVDAGLAYVFVDEDARTEPVCKKEPLYRHETGHDYWYSTDQSDTGFVGYMKP